MDDVSDGEGDEEAAVKARVEMEIQEDKERTKAVITAVTEGRDAYKKSLRKGKYSFQKLVGDNTVPLGDEEPGAVNRLLSLHVLVASTRLPSISGRRRGGDGLRGNASARSG